MARIQASDEALRTILYMSMQLHINPNLSEAVTSASGHTSGFLSKDLARIIWKTQTTKGNVARVRDALSNRMKLWRKWSPDFVESLEFLSPPTRRYKKISCEVNATYMGRTIEDSDMYILGSEDDEFYFETELEKKNSGAVRLSADHIP